MSEIIVTPGSVAVGEGITVLGILTPGGKHKPMAGYFDRDGEMLFGFPLEETADGNVAAKLSTFDWEPGEYVARMYDPSTGTYVHANPLIVEEPSQDPYQVFKDALGSARMAVFDADSKQKTGNIRPDGRYVLVVGTQGLDEIESTVKLNWTYNGAAETIIDIEVIHDAGFSVDPQTLPDTVFAQYFSFAHLRYLDLSSTFTLQWQVKNIGEDWWHKETLTGNIHDTLTESPIPANTGLLYRRFKIGVFYYGQALTDEDTEQARTLVEQAFSGATKDYYAAETFIAGAAPLPPEGPDYPYSSWWQSLPHDLSGTNFSDIDPDDPEYGAKVANFWYYKHGGETRILQEAEAIYPRQSSGEDLTIYLTDAGFEGAGKGGGQGALLSEVFLSGGWSWTVNGGKQYKDPYTWQQNSVTLLANVWIHECGHTLFGTATGDDQVRYHPYPAKPLVEDHSREVAHRTCFMSSARDREVLAGQTYFDEHLVHFLAADRPPQVTLAVSPLSVEIGQKVTVIVNAKSSLGLAGLWWWGIDTGDKDLNKAHWHDASGATEASQSWVVTFPERGTFTLCANARDSGYPEPGVAHQASEGLGIVCAQVTVGG